jgi:hypothetical protein
MSKCKANFKTDNGMSGSISGNIPGVCQELFAMIHMAETRQKIMASFIEMDKRMVEYERTKSIDLSPAS